MGVVPPLVHSIVKEEGHTLSPVDAPEPLNIFTCTKMVKTAMMPVQATRINSAIAELLVDQLLPYSFIDSAAFRKLLKTIEPRFQPLTKKCLENLIIPAWHEAEVTNLKKVLTSLDSVGLTTDLWTSRATELYMTVTVHYINERNVLSAAVLQTEKIAVSHTGANIATELDAVVQKWGLSGKTSTITTDNAANITAGVRLSGISIHIGCLAHTLNLAS